MVLSFLWRKRIFTPASEFFRSDAVWAKDRGEMGPWVLTNPRWAWETRKIGLVEKDFILGLQQKISRPIAIYF